MTQSYEPNVVLSTKEYDVIGKRPIRHDGADKVTGNAMYGADYHAAGTLYGAILRSPHAHARIKSIDTSKAEALSGVRAVVTSRDFPEMKGDERVHLGEAIFDMKNLRDGVMAFDKARFKGHPIAGVAAISLHIAEQAAKLIEVDYEVLPAVMTVHEAMKEGASLVHEELTTVELGEKLDKPSNVADHFQHKLGDVDQGFAEADVIVERELDTATVHQGYIEPHNCTVHWNKDDRVYIWNSTQGPFDVRDSTAEILGLPVSQVKLTPMEIGGGFGGKFEPYGEPVAALLSKLTSRPVKIVMTRTEEFDSTGPTPGSYIKVKMGATNDGRIVAAQAYLAYEAGAYPGSVVGAGAECVFGVYDIPNVLIDGYDVVVNKPKSRAYRAPGSTQVAFATEQVVDELAEKTGIDPMELRMMNSAKEGSRKADGSRYLRIGAYEVMAAMKDHPHYGAPLDGPNRGRGVAVGYWMNGGAQSSVTIGVNSDGTFTLVEGSPDIGGTRTSLSMQAAEVLGVPDGHIRSTVVSTDEVGYTAGTGGSRVTFATGWAAHEAAQDVKRQMIERAAMIWDVGPETLHLEAGVFRSKLDEGLSMTIKELAGELNDTGGPVVGRSTVDPKGVGNAFAGLIVDVEVDPETGKIDILRATAVQDAGKAIHPSYVEGQMQGGTAQGIGWGINEEYFMTQDGAMANSTFLDFRMPLSLDLPMIDTVIVEVANPGHPYGVRGVGEVSIAAPPGAVANAVYAALGIRMDRLPMNPGSVMQALWAKKGT